MIPSMFSRDQLKRAATLTEEDFVQLDKCRRVSATRSPMESISPCWSTSAQSNGTMSCSTANISSIGSSSASAVAQKGSSLAYKITRISLVPSILPDSTQVGPAGVPAQRLPGQPASIAGRKGGQFVRPEG